VLRVQKTVDELEDEIDSGEFKDIPSFIKAHWNIDANIDLLGKVLRMTRDEIVTILEEDLGVKLPQGSR